MGAAPRARSRVAPDDDKDAPHALFDRAGSDDELRKAQAPSPTGRMAVEDQFNTCLENLRAIGPLTPCSGPEPRAVVGAPQPRPVPGDHHRPPPLSGSWSGAPAVVRKNTSEALEGCFGSPEPVQRRSGERPMSFGGSGLSDPTLSARPVEVFLFLVLIYLKRQADLVVRAQ